jgi:hypothetical protein
MAVTVHSQEIPHIRDEVGFLEDKEQLERIEDVPKRTRLRVHVIPIAVAVHGELASEAGTLIVSETRSKCG